MPATDESDRNGIPSYPRPAALGRPSAEAPWRQARHYGTIGGMRDHRIRLSDDDIDLIVAALRARAAMTGRLRRHRVERLADRLAECRPGNPKWLLDEEGQTHEEDLDDE